MEHNFLTIHTYPDIFENGEFVFLRFCLSNTRIRCFRSPKTTVFEEALQRVDFWQTYRVEKPGCHQRFEIPWARARMVVFAYPCGRANTIRKRFLVDVDFLIYGDGKSLRFRKYPDIYTCVRGLSLLKPSAAILFASQDL